MRFSLFKSKEEPKLPPPQDEGAEQQQGGYTDHAQSAYSLRQSTEPLHGEELEAFEWVINHMAEKYPQLAESQSKLIDKAMDENWFFTGDEGELRVTEESP